MLEKSGSFCHELNYFNTAVAPGQQMDGLKQRSHPYKHLQLNKCYVLVFDSL